MGAQILPWNDPWETAEGQGLRGGYLIPLDG